jgi:hypothetical protein
MQRHCWSLLIYLLKISGSSGRIHRIGDIDEISRQVDQVSPLAGIIFTLRLLRQFDGAGAICEGTAGVMIDKARHAGFASTNPRAVTLGVTYWRQL